jgi:Reverse transcriptase (RNA-dependent DNA polymerase)
MPGCTSVTRKDIWQSNVQARICAGGDPQPNGLQGTYVVTLYAKTFRAMMGTAAYLDLEAYQWDIQNAFVNAAVDEVFVEFPDGFKKHDKALLLQKVLYGLRRPPQLWQKDFITTLITLGDTIAFCYRTHLDHFETFERELSRGIP